MSYRERYGSKKADYKNAQRVGVGVVGHSILHHHEENVGGTRPNQPEGVVLRGWLAWSLGLDHVLLGAMTAPRPSIRNLVLAGWLKDFKPAEGAQSRSHPTQYG